MHSFMTSQEWLDYYDHNAIHRLPLPWEGGHQLTPAESWAVIESLRAWQLGETSEALQLQRLARRYGTSIGDDLLFTIVQRFIAEEQRHGELLGRFLDLHGTARLKRNWADSVFRRMRHCLSSFEIWTTVVLIVETEALIYYRAILNATNSPLLQALCRQILKDEVQHLRYQYERLAQICLLHGLVRRFWTKQVHRLLVSGITLAVWVGHHRALTAGGFSFWRFWTSVWRRMNLHWRLMRPERWQVDSRKVGRTARLSARLSS